MREGGVRPPEGQRDFGERWVSFSPRAGGRAGLHQNLHIGRVLRSDTVEAIAAMLDRVAEEVHAAMPRGLVYASIFLLEYGRRIAGSPGELYFDDGGTFFVQSFEGVPGSTLEQFHDRVRRVLARVVSTDHSAVLVEHATVRAYQERVGAGVPRRSRTRRR